MLVNDSLTHCSEMCVLGSLQCAEYFPEELNQPVTYKGGWTITVKSMREVDSDVCRRDIEVNPPLPDLGESSPAVSPAFDPLTGTALPVCVGICKCPLLIRMQMGLH